VKMLPFDNKSEFQVILDLPEGTTLEMTQAAAQDIAAYLHTVPEVDNTQVYAGVAAPFNFNGLVRHYFMRRGPNVAHIQVNRVGKHGRKRRGLAMGVEVGPGGDALAARCGAGARIAEIPPGPPVLSPLVAEIYAPDAAARIAAAREVLEIFESTPGVV